MKTAEEHQGAWEDESRYIQGFRAERMVRALLADYQALEASHRHLLSIVVALGEWAAADEQDEATLESVCAKALRVVAMTRQREREARTAEARL